MNWRAAEIQANLLAQKGNPLDLEYWAPFLSSPV